MICGHGKSGLVGYPVSHWTTGGRHLIHVSVVGAPEHVPASQRRITSALVHHIPGQTVSWARRRHCHWLGSCQACGAAVYAGLLGRCTPASPPSGGYRPAQMTRPLRGATATATGAVPARTVQLWGGGAARWATSRAASTATTSPMRG